MALFLSLFFFSLIAYFLFRSLRHLYQRSVQKTAVLITGCDSGFGLLCAKRFALRGIKVFAACLTEEGVHRLQHDVDLVKGQCGLVALQLDVTKNESVENAARFVEKELDFQQIHNLSIINNAGIAQGFWLELSKIEEIENCVQVNCLGVARVTKAFLPLIRKGPKKGGRVINITSMYGGLTTPGFTAYSTSKYGAEGFSDALRTEMKHVGVPVVTIQPAYVRTPMVADGLARLEKTVETADPEILKTYPTINFRERFRLLKAIINIIMIEPEEVIETLWDVYVAESPNNHYPVGVIAWLFSFLRILPSELVDLIASFL